MQIKNIKKIKKKIFFNPKIIKKVLNNAAKAFLDIVKKIMYINKIQMKNKINFLLLSCLYLEIKNNKIGKDIDNHIPVQLGLLNKPDTPSPGVGCLLKITINPKKVLNGPQ